MDDITSNLSTLFDCSVGWFFLFHRYKLDIQVCVCFNYLISSCCLLHYINCDSIISRLESMNNISGWNLKIIVDLMHSKEPLNYAYNIHQIIIRLHCRLILICCIHLRLNVSRVGSSQKKIRLKA